jgi:hypothetical protein
MSPPEPIRYVLERVQEEVRKLYAHVPETIRLEETELTAEERRLGNFIDFVGEGRGTRALAKALEESERKVEGLRDGIQGLQQPGRASSKPRPSSGSTSGWLSRMCSSEFEPLSRQPAPDGRLGSRRISPQ